MRATCKARGTPVRFSLLFAYVLAILTQGIFNAAAQQLDRGSAIS